MQKEIVIVVILYEELILDSFVPWALLSVSFIALIA